MGRGEKILKELIVVYIQKGLTLGYIAQTLNLFYSHSFSNMGLTHYFFFWENKSISIRGCKNPIVAILPPKSLNPCYIQVCKPKFFYILWTVWLHICNLTIHKM